MKMSRAHRSEDKTGANREASLFDARLSPVEIKRRYVAAHRRITARIEDALPDSLEVQDRLRLKRKLKILLTRALQTRKPLDDKKLARLIGEGEGAIDAALEKHDEQKKNEFNDLIQLMREVRQQIPRKRLFGIFSRKMPRRGLADPDLLEHIFKGEDRIWLPLGEDAASDEQTGKTEAEVARALAWGGYRITDYRKGLATDATGKQSLRIARLLTADDLDRNGKPLIDAFNMDARRVGTSMMIVVSRHPWDVARASAVRAWESCAGPRSRLRDAWEDMDKEIRAGTIIAYLVREGDVDINDPLARVMLKPFHDKKHKNTIWHPVSRYGLQHEGFQAQLRALAWEINAHAPSGVYVRSCEVYPEGDDRVYHPGRGDANIDAVKWLRSLGFHVEKRRGKWEIGPGVDLAKAGVSMPRLPDMSKMRCRGPFRASGIGLETLEGLPHEVGGLLDVSNNRLSDLRGCPSVTNDGWGDPGVIDASGNLLTSLEGAPASIGKLDVSRNFLTSLKGAPKRIVNHLDTSFNALTSLEGAPAQEKRDVMEHFDVSFNPLPGLQGGPRFVILSYKAVGCQLTSLEGAPENRVLFFDCSLNQLERFDGLPPCLHKLSACFNSLRKLQGLQKSEVDELILRGNLLECPDGLPSAVRILDLRDNRLHSLEGLPDKLSVSLDLRNNRLTALTGAPQYVGKDFLVSDNRLTSLEGGPVAVGRHYAAAGNFLKCLTGAPREIHGHLDVSDNRLTGFEGAPQKIAGDFDLRGNPLPGMEHFPQTLGGQAPIGRRRNREASDSIISRPVPRG